MSDGHPKTAPDKVNTLAVGTIAIASALVIWASILFLQAYYRDTNDTLAQEREVEGQGRDARLVRLSQQGQLSAAVPEVLDKESGMVRVNIDYAMSEVLKVLQADPTASTVPIYGAHNKPTVPAVWGRPSDDAKPPPAPGESVDGQPADGQPADGQPVDGQPADGQPTSAQPADAQPGQPSDGPIPGATP